MSKAKMEAARELIQEKKYEEARAILRTVDHPLAAEWLNKIDAIKRSQPQPKPPSKSLSILPIAAVSIILIIIVAGAVILVRRQNAPEVAASVVSSTLTPSLIPTTLSTATLAPTSTPQSTSSATGAWQVTSKTSALDNTKTVVLDLEAQDEVRDNTLSSKPQLIVRCTDSLTEIYVAARMQLDENYETKTSVVAYRLDKNPIQTFEAGLATSGDAFFFENPKKLLGQMKSATTLAIGFTPFQSSQVSTSFDLTGFVAAIATSGQTCGWELY